jgi:prophage antirepressor-like protein
MSTESISFTQIEEMIEIRTVVIDGEPWFVAKDIAVALGYTNIRGTVSRHCKRPQQVGSTVSVPLDQQTVIIPESDVYRLIMRSKLESAEEFEVWVTEEVLPTIRKTGGVYMTPEKTEELLADPDLIIALANQVKSIKAERDEAIRTNDVSCTAR